MKLPATGYGLAKCKPVTSRQDSLYQALGTLSTTAQALARWRVDVRDPALSLEDLHWLWGRVRAAVLRLLLRWARH
jgi:hypothetical protein